MAVGNFIGLAAGTREWPDPKSGERTNKPFFDGLIFHQVLPPFMVMTGDPLGNGLGDPGYTLSYEPGAYTESTLEGGFVIMVPRTTEEASGSQFLITLMPTPWIGPRPGTVFGKVVEGMDVVKRISLVPRDHEDRPLTPVVLEHVQILP
jgi:peptidyl-prolyl cis-trans isomerase A (cyclophilin A)